MMFVTCFQKDSPRSSRPVIEIVPDNEDSKSNKSSKEEPNGFVGERRYNLRAIPVGTKTSSHQRIIKSVKSILCCGCCAHPSISPSQEDILEIRISGIPRHDDGPNSAIHSIRSKFTELRAESLDEAPAHTGENVRSSEPNNNSDKGSSRITSEKSFSSKHFEKIYSISENLDNVYKTIPTNNAHFLFTRNSLGTQDTHCNADGAETKSVGSRHSKKSMNYFENTSINSNRSCKVINNISTDLPQIHKVVNLKNVSPKKSDAFDIPSDIKSVDNISKENLPRDQNFIDSFKNAVHNPNIENLSKEIPYKHPVKENKSLSAGKTISSPSYFYHQLIENKPKTALAKENVAHNIPIEDKLSVKENTWFENSNINVHESDAESIGNHQSDWSISSNHLSFGRSLSIDSNESFEKVVVSESLSGDTKSISKSSLNTVINKLKENSISTLVNVHGNDGGHLSDENNNKQNIRDVEEIFDFTQSFEKDGLEKVQDNFHCTEVMIYRNDPISIAQFATSNLTQVNEKLSRKVFPVDHNDNELQYENKNQVINHESGEFTSETTVDLKADKSTTKNNFDLKSTDERVACKMKQNAMTQHEECERLTTSLNINTSSHQHESNDFDSETNFERNYESDDDRNDGFQKEPYDMCQVAISTTEDKASLHPGSANTDHTLQRRSSQSEDILQDVFGTSHQNNRYDTRILFCRPYLL
ncbi:hypothetical protein M8J75_007454 [Diaphorina citri]|nr:hypothetical protein M8J75_007454 [Diaphorina citri]KAI5752364.1 hypothetical protein M8J77_016365 [Diaphorina citri]